MSEAQQLLTKAQTRLARARLALEDATARDIHDPPGDDELMQPGETP